MAIFLLICYFCSFILAAGISLANTFATNNAIYVDIPTLIDTLRHGLIYGLVIFTLLLPIFITVGAKIKYKQSNKSIFILFAVLIAGAIVGIIVGGVCGALYYNAHAPDYAPWGSGGFFNGFDETVDGILIGFGICVVLTYWLYRYKLDRK
jgi:hypothetical protein